MHAVGARKQIRRDILAARVGDKIATTPVCVLVTATVALATAAPDWSVTLPRMRPAFDCANTAEEVSRVTTMKAAHVEKTAARVRDTTLLFVFIPTLFRRILNFRNGKPVCWVGVSRKSQNSQLFNFYTGEMIASRKHTTG